MKLKFGRGCRAELSSETGFKRNPLTYDVSTSRCEKIKGGFVPAKFNTNVL